MDAAPSTIETKPPQCVIDNPRMPRSKTAKSRTGCKQCKLRRIKCDEAMPGCRNCARKGLPCPGYKRDLRWSVKHEQGLDVRPSRGNAWLARREATASSTRDVTPSTEGTGVNTVRGANALVSTRSGTPSSSIDLSFFHAPIDTSSALVQYWFDSVCPLWSTFDSDISYNRKIPLHTWTSSEPVYFALQAMSAAYLADSIPQVQSMLPSLISQATSVIVKKMAALRDSPNIPAANITIDLLFAVFAMGTSMHWADTSRFDDELLQYASEMLGLWEANLTAVDAMVHAYFHQALTHWKMLAALAAPDKGHDLVNRDWLRDQGKLRREMQMSNGEVLNTSQLQHSSPMLIEAGLHSWCGVSSEVVHAFGRVVALCRSSRSQWREAETSRAESTFDEPSDIGLAWDLQQQLLGMNFDLKVSVQELLGISMRTGDEKTPLLHLVLTAEAYRLASLLQLHITFDTLIVKRTEMAHTFATAGAVKFTAPESATHEQKLVAMALQLTMLLERIPADSGSRCNQPVLLILAAAGLRFNTDTNLPSLLPITSHRILLSSPSAGNAAHLGGYSKLDDAPSDPLSSRPSVRNSDETFTQASFEVAKARRFVKSRLRILRETLPPKPVDVALNLVDAIWSAYDSVRPGAQQVDWVEVMESTGFRTVFS